MDATTDHRTATDEDGMPLCPTPEQSEAAGRVLGAAGRTDAAMSRREWERAVDWEEMRAEALYAALGRPWPEEQSTRWRWVARLVVRRAEAATTLEPAVAVLERFAATLPEGHVDRPGVLRAVEVLRHS